MKNMLGRDNKTHIVIIIFTVLFTLGCLCLPGSVTPTETPLVFPDTPIPVITEPPIVIRPTKTPVLSESLSADGPWLVMNTEVGLWATNPDGSGLTRLTGEEYLGNKLAIQPRGNQIVFLTPPEGSDYHNMTLNVVTLPDGNITKITDLTSPETEIYADRLPGEEGYDALIAVRDLQNLAWSPDGTRLAFTGLMDGPTADIYIYETMTGEIKRVSEDDDQNYWPSWSPDGEHLLYLGAEQTSYGPLKVDVWLADGDGENASRLYETDGQGEIIKGWLDNTTVLLDTFTIHCENRLRFYDVVSRQEDMLVEGCVLGAATDGWNGLAIYADDSGLYLLKNEDRTPLLVSDQEVSWIYTPEPIEYYIRVLFKDGSLATYRRGDFVDQISPITTKLGSLDVAMYGMIWGWTSDDPDQPGVWITGPGIEIGQIFEEPAILPIWDFNNNLLFFSSQDGEVYDLYRSTFDAYYTDLEKLVTILACISDVFWLGW